MKRTNRMNRMSLKALVVALFLTMSLAEASAQLLRETRPSEETPKTAPKIKKPSKPPVDEPSAKPLMGEDTTILERLNGLVLVKSYKEINVSGVNDVSGLRVVDIPLLQTKEFEAIAQKYLGGKFMKSTYRNLARDIVVYCRKMNRPVVDVVMPQQEIRNGTVQLWFIEAKVGEVKVENEGKKWFSDQKISREVHVKAAESIDSARLTRDLDWLNRNPFRQTDVQFRPGKNFGETDLILQVQDRIPFRPYISYENSGTRNTGPDQIVAGFNWGNIFGTGHQLSYQYSTDTTLSKLGAQSAGYVIPLPWRHILSIYGSYVEVDTDVGGLDLKGSSYAVSTRYAIPLPTRGRLHHEVSLGIDYRNTDNSLEFGGSTVSEAPLTVGQLSLGYSASLPDKWGQTQAAIEFYYSPGGIFGDDTDERYEALRVGSPANYYYTRVVAERITRLPADFSWMLRITGQYTLERLLPSEQLGFGGYGSVRGYDGRAVAGDYGVMFSNELRTPPISLLRMVKLAKATSRVMDQLQFLVFFDYGMAFTVNPDPVFDEKSSEDLYSVGGGVRYVINNYLSLHFDYGMGLKNVPNSKSSMGHFGLTISY